MRGGLWLIMEGSEEFEMGRVRQGRCGGDLGCAARAAKATCSGRALWRSSSGQAGRRRVQPGLHLRRAMRRLPDGAERDERDQRRGELRGAHCYGRTDTVFPVQAATDPQYPPCLSVQMALLCRIKAAEAGPPGRAETRDYRAQDPFNPQFCAEACFMCKAAVMKVPRSIGCPSPRAVVPRMLRAPFTIMAGAKGSGRPIIIPTISRRWYCPPSKQAQLASENRSLLKEQG